ITVHQRFARADRMARSLFDGLTLSTEFRVLSFYPYFRGTTIPAVAVTCPGKHQPPGPRLRPNPEAGSAGQGWRRVFSRRSGHASFDVRNEQSHGMAGAD